MERITVAVETPAGTPCCQALADGLAAKGLLRLLDEPRPAQLRLLRLAPRGRPMSGEPAAILGPLDQPGWVVTDGEGELLGPFLPDDSIEGPDRLVEMVLGPARQLALEDLAAVSGKTRAAQVELVPLRRVESLLEEVENWRDGKAMVEEGEEMAFKIRSPGATELWSCLLDLGLTAKIERLHPEQGIGQPIAPGQTACVDSLQLYLPEGYPFYWPEDPWAWGRERLLLFTSTEPVDLDPLFGLAGRADERSALGRILEAILIQAALPSPPDLLESSWSAVFLSFTVRRGGVRR